MGWDGDKILYLLTGSIMRYINPHFTYLRNYRCI